MHSTLTRRLKHSKTKRVFAYTDTGIPDGIQLDSEGNVYSGCGDGVHVRFSPSLSMTYSSEPTYGSTVTTLWCCTIRFTQFIGVEPRRDIDWKILPGVSFC